MKQEPLPIAAPLLSNPLPKPKKVVDPLAPAAGGWTPNSWQMIVLPVAVSVFASVGTVIATPGLTTPVLLGAIMLGLSSGLATLSGLKSAGRRKL